MNKILSALICTLALLTFSAQAQAALIFKWDYNLNIDFVNDDGSLTDTFTWETTSTDWFGRPQTSTGNITGADSLISDSVGVFGDTIVSPLTFDKSGMSSLEAASGTVRFSFEFFPNGNLDLGQTVSVDIDFTTDASGLFPTLTFADAEMYFYYDGYKYDWDITTLLSSASPNFYLSFDAIKVDAPIPNPEPATMLLMGAGLAGLGFAARRRAKANK